MSVANQLYVYYATDCLWSRVGVLKAVFAKTVEGANVLDLCRFGDQMMLEETSKVYKKEKEMKKGVC